LAQLIERAVDLLDAETLPPPDAAEASAALPAAPATAIAVATPEESRILRTRCIIA
jgi:hypothetical protein